MNDATRFCCAVDVWALIVRHAADTLLSLGRPYEAKFALPAPDANERIVDIADLGFHLTSVQEAGLLLRVTTLKDPVLIKPQVVDSAAQDPELRIRAIAEDDFLVGMGLVDFRVMPRSLERFRKELQSEQQQTTEGKARGVTLHFIRLDQLVVVDPSLMRTHDSVLETLAKVDRMRKQLAAQYDELLTQDYKFVLAKVSAEIKLLEFIHVVSQEIRSTIMENQPFQLAQLRHLFEEMNESYSDDEVEDNERKQRQEEQALQTHDSALQTERGAFQQPNQTIDLAKQVSEQIGSPEQPRRPSEIFAGDEITPDQQSEAPAPEQSRQSSGNCDQEWIDLILPDQIEWFPNAKTTLCTVYQDIMNGFMANEEDTSSIHRVCRKMTEYILQIYKLKLESKNSDNSAIHNEFTRHIRMLLEKLKLFDNKPLCSDLMSGVLSVEEICEVSSTELAPYVFRSEIQSQFEQCAQSSKIESTESVSMTDFIKKVHKSEPEAESKFDITQATILGDRMMRSADTGTWNVAGVTANQMVKNWPTSLWILLLDTLLMHQSKDSSEKQNTHIVDRLLPPHLDAIGAFCRKHLTETNIEKLRFRWLTLSLRAHDLRMLANAIEFVQKPDCTKYIQPLFLDLSNAVGPELMTSLLASNRKLRDAVARVSGDQITTKLTSEKPIIPSGVVQVESKDVIFTEDAPAVNGSVDDTANKAEATHVESKPKKKVTFAGTLTSVREIESRRDPPKPFGFYKFDNEPNIPPPTQNLPIPKHPRRPVSANEGVAFLRALYSPNYYLIGLVNELCNHLRAEKIVSLGREFNLAPGVVIYRQSLSRGSSDFKAQFQLAHLFCESKGLSKHDANLKSSEKLAALVTTFRRKFDDILQKLKCNFEFGVASTRQAEDSAFSFLVESKIVKIDASYLNKSYEATVSFDGLPLATYAHENEAIARHEGKEILMKFLMEMICLVDVEAKSPSTEPSVVPRQVDSFVNSYDLFDSCTSKENSNVSGNCDDFSTSRKRYHSIIYLGNLKESTRARRRRVDQNETASPESRRASITDKMAVYSPARPVGLSFSAMKQADDARFKGLHASATEVVSTATQECAAKNSQGRGVDGLTYNESSESTGTDDARFRAILRSLFTVDDHLCAGIKSLQESLKYTGAAKTQIVANVKATIKMERLREGSFEVRVAVNDVVFFVASERTKYEAGTAAVDGAIRKLNEIRCVWAQLLHFFHMKSLNTTDDVDAFHSLRLTNIAKIITAAERLPKLVKWSPNQSEDSDVHCVIRINGIAVFRASGKTESDARRIADGKTAAFLKNLIDEGLDPEPILEETVITSNEIVCRDVAADVIPSVDWCCLIRMQDVSDAQCFQEFRVEGLWCIRNNIPSETAFPLKDIVLTQRSLIPMVVVENFLSNLHPSALFFFSLDSAYEQRKFVKAVTAFGDKRRAKAHVLVLDVSPASEFVMYLIPPGATINSANNLYWPVNRLPRELADRKIVYGFLMPGNV